MPYPHYLTRKMSRNLAPSRMGQVAKYGANMISSTARLAQSGLAYEAGRQGVKQIYRYFKPKGKKRMTVKLNQGAVRGVGGSFSKFNYGRRRMNKFAYRMFKNVNNNYYATNGTFRITQTAGKQALQTILKIFDLADFSTINTKLNSNNATNRICYKSLSAEIMITNQDQANVRIMLYEFICRRDCVNTNVYPPETAMQNAYADEGGSGSDRFVVGTTPFSADILTQFYKCLKITHIILPPGGLHVHKVHFGLNKVCSDEMFVQQGAAGNIKGCTCYTMLQAYGEPANDATTKTSVSTGQVALDVVWRKQYKYNFINDSTTTWSKTDNLTTFAVSQEEINPLTDSVITADVVA